jgi:hypothetical protein
MLTHLSKKVFRFTVEANGNAWGGNEAKTNDKDTLPTSKLTKDVEDSENDKATQNKVMPDKISKYPEL